MRHVWVEEMTELLGAGTLLAIVGYFIKKRLDKLEALESLGSKVDGFIALMSEKPHGDNSDAKFVAIMDLVQGIDSKLDGIQLLTQDVAVIKRDLQTVWRRFDEVMESVNVVNTNLAELIKYTQGLNQKVQIIRMKSERQGNWNYSESEQNLLNS